jgi:tetratricopeptide (TPR) repeat protein
LLKTLFLLLPIVLLLGQEVFAQKSDRRRQKKVELTFDTGQFNPKDEGLVIEGMKFMIRGEFDRALPIFEELAGSLPNSATAHYLLGTAQAKLKRPEVEESARKAYELDKKNEFFGKFLAENLARQKKYKEAAAIYEEIIGLDPSNVQNNIELAAAYLFSDQPAKALETYDRLEKQIGVTEEVTKQKQQLYLRQNKLDKAIEEAQKLINSDPEESYYYVELAELYIANELLDNAVDALDKALRINPDEAQARILLADIYRRRGEKEKCNEELRLVFQNPDLDIVPKIRVMSGYLEMLKSGEDRTDALELVKLLVDTHPSDAKPYVLYGDQLVRANQREKARDTYAKAARIDGSIYEVWVALLQLDGELNQFDSLLVHSEQALELFPNQGILWYSNGSANLVKKNYAEAVSALEESRKLITNNPTLRRFIHAQLGDAYNGTEEHAKSDMAYELVLSEDPENDHVLNNYSYFLSLRKENLDKARAMSSKLVKKHPENATYLDTHAWVLYMLKDYQGAKQFLEKALEKPENASPTLLDHYGDVLSRLGQKEKAIEQWKKAKEMGDTSKEIDRKIASGSPHD